MWMLPLICRCRPVYLINRIKKPFLRSLFPSLSGAILAGLGTGAIPPWGNSGIRDGGGGDLDGGLSAERQRVVLGVKRVG